MTKPERIQRKRTKGWKMPPNTIYVGRPTEWGNPYRVGPDGDAASCVAKYRELATVKNVWSIPNARKAVEDLRGHDLACWCALDQPCHADVLLEIANA